jgi:hypothetical protein
VYTARAQEYLSKSGGPRPEPPPITPKKSVEKFVSRSEPEKTTPMPATGVKRVGERMGIAVLPFQTQGLGSEIRQINIVEQLMTTFYSLDRFRQYEQTQLEKILEEQKLGMTGVLDAPTAAEIISAQDELSERTNIQELKNTIQRLAHKIVQDLPLVEGVVIDVSREKLTLNIGSSNGIRKDMKRVV